MNSKDMQRLQTTQQRDYPLNQEMEFQERVEVHSISSASKDRRNNVQRYTSNMLEMILDRGNMIEAYKRVVANKGSHGVDGMEVDELLPYLKENWPTIKQQLLEGKYKPQPVLRVEIPKPDGGTRLLGIPTVLDRLIQQAIAQILSGIYDHTFSGNSYGFRPRRSAKDAVIAAETYINEGCTWVVDIDLEKFFDRVNHDILMSKLEKRIGDKRVLKLIRRYLESGVMINGIKVATGEGTPQGGPLSPLLANIMLDELDKELERRGHKFCRYADDCNIYVKSRSAGNRVMKSIKKFIETKLKLKVNEAKSAVDRPWKRKFLGFSFYIKENKVRIRIHEKSIKRFKEKVREITNRNKGISMGYRIRRLNQITTGWVNYFGLADAKGIMRTLDEWIRRRLRACIWKQWKKIKTKYDNLIKLGLEKQKAWEYANTRKGYWRISHSPVLNITLTNKYFEGIGYKSLSKRYLIVH
ncbi:group II intron reverse transcriptase/maturase [Thermoanaerobacterium thermosaccharolyticum]|jgi:Group II intron, maturase-specific domain./Reverse transcriptase (RNA-dependent DNA polymerase).|uniref:group II intron reverse transcriptase/maturase n=1 Tax=Thermoanaerobacterium thermosaccharolyticum TaxID=1517 RepID=UPI0027A7EF71|nr:group II intron reverse transcriptase/maturase [Thermoanaerobacterium thermosaccharolyticum]WHE07850.1 group II intron reverse transcriptase/maturase [Thermoanaerobacterium thermosaccharolyticum]